MAERKRTVASLWFFWITDLGEVPTNNPYLGAGGVRCNESVVLPVGSPNCPVFAQIFARGLRNLYRISMGECKKDRTRFYTGGGCQSRG